MEAAILRVADEIQELSASSRKAGIRGGYRDFLMLGHEWKFGALAFSELARREGARSGWGLVDPNLLHRASKHVSCFRCATIQHRARQYLSQMSF